MAKRRSKKKRPTRLQNQQARKGPMWDCIEKLMFSGFRLCRAINPRLTWKEWVRLVRDA